MEIIIIEDNDTMRLGMSESLRREGYDTADFAEGAAAVEYIKTHHPALVITDLRMEGMNGLQVLEKVKSIRPQTEVLLISAYGTVQDAVKAMRLGAADFLTKPFSPEELRLRVRQIVERLEKEKLIDRLRAENEYLAEETAQGYAEMVGSSPAMQEIFTLIRQVAREDSAVLIEGESGTGKELVARAIHRNSPRSEGPFIKVNCGALNDNLLESELFGHEKGAFTGALRQKKGRFELADGGTLFLDEIGDISQAMQVKLLRVLQDQEFERVGGEQTLKVDVRLVAATNRDLKALLNRGIFREDLYYRLSVIPIRLPSLRQRRDDIPALVRHFLKRFNQKRGQEKHIDDEGMRLLQEYSWPGNIRELENLIERLHIISDSDDIPAVLIARFLNTPTEITRGFESLPLEEALYAFERHLLLQALKEADGVKNRAAKILGIRTSTLYYKLEKFGLRENAGA